MESKYITLALIAAICISLGGTFITLNKLSEVQQMRYVTGYTSSSAGTGTIQISEVQSIIVNSSNDTINFGICKGNTSDLRAYNLTSNSTTDNLGSWANCPNELPHFPGFIQVINDGNQDVNLTVRSSLTASEFIGGNNPALPLFKFITYNDTANGNGGCNTRKDGGTGGVSVIDDWFEFTQADKDYQACYNFTYDTTRKTAVRLYLMVQIPTNPVPGTHQTSITFMANPFLQ